MLTRSSLRTHLPANSDYPPPSRQKRHRFAPKVPCKRRYSRWQFKAFK
uniref:Uncharacterized protein n=1 Tax=Rhizophora mucronata TaxID=61149 RepID=A0A2P2N6K0_RHIMU